jgi:exodeoxyribonuclease VII small subunit
MNSGEKPLPTFESALADLEQVVHELEDGQIGLEAALARYETGVKLLRHCYSFLNQAEQRIQMVSGVDASGQPVLKPVVPETSP